MKIRKAKTPALICNVHMFLSSAAVVFFKAISMQAAPCTKAYYITSTLFMAAGIYVIVSSMAYSSMRSRKKFIWGEMGEKSKLNKLKSTRAVFILLLTIIFSGVLISAATKESYSISHDHFVIIFFLAIAVEEGSFLLLEKGVFEENMQSQMPD
jgi:hypothetical protein